MYFVCFALRQALSTPLNKQIPCRGVLLDEGTALYCLFCTTTTICSTHSVVIFVALVLKYFHHQGQYVSVSAVFFFFLHWRCSIFQHSAGLGVPILTAYFAVARMNAPLNPTFPISSARDCRRFLNEGSNAIPQWGLFASPPDNVMPAHLARASTHKLTEICLFKRRKISSFVGMQS